MEVTIFETAMMSTLDLAKLLTAASAGKIKCFGRDFNEVTSVFALAANHLAKGQPVLASQTCQDLCA